MVWTTTINLKYYCSERQTMSNTTLFKTLDEMHYFNLSLITSIEIKILPVLKFGQQGSRQFCFTCDVIYLNETTSTNIHVSKTRDTESEVEEDIYLFRKILLSK